MMGHPVIGFIRVVASLPRLKNRSSGQGWRKEFADEGAKIWYSGYYRYQKSPKKSLFTIRREANMLQLGAIAP